MRAAGALARLVLEGTCRASLAHRRIVRVRKPARCAVCAHAVRARRCIGREIRPLAAALHAQAHRLPRRRLELTGGARVARAAGAHFLDLAGAGTPGSTRRRLGSRRRSQTDQARTHRRRKLWPWPCASRQGTRRSYRHSPLPSTCLPDSRRSADRSRQRTQGCRCRSSRSKRRHSLCEACRQRTARSSCSCPGPSHLGTAPQRMLCSSTALPSSTNQLRTARKNLRHRATGTRPSVTVRTVRRRSDRARSRDLACHTSNAHRLTR